MQVEKKTLRNIFLVAVGCIILNWILRDFERVKTIYFYAKSIMAPFLLGASFAFIINVPMRAIENMLHKITNLKVRRVVALSITSLAALLLLALVFWLLIPQLVGTVKALIPKVEVFFAEAELEISQLFKNQEKLKELFDFEKISAFLNFDKLNIYEIYDKLGGAFSVIGSISDAVINIVLAVVFAFYCLFQKETLARQARKLVYAFLPEHMADEAVRIARLSDTTFSDFLSGQCIEVVILGSMYAVSMMIFRMPYAPLVSVLVAITAFIPVVGAWVGCIFGTFLIMVEDPMQAAWFVLLFIIIQIIENNLIYPRVVGNSMGLSGMWVLVAITIGGSLMGVAGMIIMIPVVSVIYTLLGEFTNKRLQKRQVASEKLMPQPPDLRGRKKRKRKIETDTKSDK